MDSLMNTFFSPLGKEWCLYYFFVLVFVFIISLLAVIASLIEVINLKKKTFSSVLMTLLPILTYAILYFQSRLIYSMCVGSLK
uniref:Uncharacterized protein n=1 Tax=viral metagenome TaxID=1070528 RepID=A0A6C0DHL8_9ZZZZ